MSSKNSNRLKCRHCEIINWSTDQFCRRCHQPLAKPSAQTGDGISPQRFQLYVYLFIAAIIIPFLVGRSDPAIGAGLGFLFILPALIINLYCNVSILVDMFRVSVVWGLAGIFLSPIANLIFIGQYWNRVRTRFLTSCAVTAYIFIIIIGINLFILPEVVKNEKKNSPVPASKTADRQMPPSRTDFVPQKSPGTK